VLQVTDQLIQEMTDIIVREVNPRAVILFGSHARGDARQGSDLDFLVVEDGPFGPGRTREDAMVKLWQILFDYAVPLDFLVYSPEEVEKWKDAPNHVIAHALKDGKVVYERH
jgi:predicted nucleotidyltransferase